MSVLTLPGARKRDFSRLFRQHYPAVLAFLRRRVPPSHAEELAADVFERAWRGFDSLKGMPLPWLYGIARNVMREFYRTRRETENLDDHELESYAGYDAIDLSLDISEAFLRLSYPDQEILSLHAWEGLDHPEIAEVLGISRNNVRVRLHRARTHLSELTGDFDA
ncbi:RNA polymerase sigma factor [Corynebacterium sp. YSMAA1_1_D6]|uniref:RNA polymerase sigma factor n=1 Tax=Corynebacterium sp. YSMAA1_1_D6 TaxID=3383589 RepID=UPI0038D1634F